ncbi:uncharacterized protein LOC107363276 isoform X2 [Tetranychus urticae]|uniref:Uncharacterized protein n=1 Tax=Tetranychus urticae TaxID=32264 RepID=T1KDP7_TETUR|nr:uncharacterized protein LOC107363276 isoform X1 [Tetranychus urticae]XP_025016756.1 uncharacterized protein LOC107363276 isoform X2 [Tetranychus urticae]
MKLINASKQLSHNNCFNNRYNFISIMKVCLIYISFGCFFVSSLPLNGHSSDPGQSLGDYTFTGLADDSQQDPSSPSLTPSSSSLSGSPSAGSVAGLISANGNNLDSAKEWIQLRNLLSELGQQKVLTPSTYRTWKRSCTIDAGMTYNCDFRQLLSAVNARKYLESSLTPGRRKRPFSTIYNQPFNY